MRFVIAGTFVTHAVGVVYYGKLMDRIGADLITLPYLGLGPLEASVDRVIEILDGYPKEEHDLVGHSQGGLVAVGVANKRPDLVDRVVAIGAPFAGAWLTHKTNVVPSFRDMAPHSRFVQGLHANSDMLAISLENDFVVRPHASNALPDMPHIEHGGAGHVTACITNGVLVDVEAFLDKDMNVYDGHVEYGAAA